VTVEAAGKISLVAAGDTNVGSRPHSESADDPAKLMIFAGSNAAINVPTALDREANRCCPKNLGTAR
jgi:hypothetical protein